MHVFRQFGRQLRNYRRTFLGGSVLLVALLLTACPGVTTVTLSISPPNPTTTVGGATITFTATLVGSSDTVTWSLSGSGTLSPATGTTTVYTPPASGGATSATITATAAGQTAMTDITVNVATVSLSISPSSLTATVGDGATTFTATLTGSSDTVTWTLTGPGSISTTTGTTTAYTPPATGTGGSATLQADAAGETDTASITINPPPSITVSGTVVDLFGQPQNGLAVKIGSSTTNTDTNGNFSISNVTVPYNAIVVDGANSRGYVFEGLTLTAPTLQLFNLGFFPPDNSATINTGNLSGGAGFANPPNHNARVAFGSPEGFSNPVFLGPGGGPNYAGPTTVSWSGPATTSGALHALQFEVDGSGLPTDYTGYGTTPLALSNGGTFNSTATDVVLSSGVADTSLTGSSTLPATYTPGLTTLYSDFGTNQSLPLLFDFSPSNFFTYTTPNVSGSTITTVVQANEPGGGTSGAYVTGSATNATAVSLSVPEVPEQVLPANNATGVTTATPFSWQDFPGGITVVGWVFPGITYIVTTANNQATIPDLSAEGLGLPATTTGFWQTIGIAPFSSVDAAAGSAGYAQDFLRAFFPFGFGPAPEANGSFGITSTRNLTTQ